MVTAAEPEMMDPKDSTFSNGPAAYLTGMFIPRKNGCAERIVPIPGALLVSRALRKRLSSRRRRKYL